MPLETIWQTRPCTSPADHELAVELLLAYRAATSLESYPTPWRLRLLLTSRVWSTELDTRLWFQPEAQQDLASLASLAFLWRRKADSPYLALEHIFHPDQWTASLEEMMLTWGVQRAQEIAISQGEPISLYANTQDPNGKSGEILASLGFDLLLPDKENANRYYTRPLRPPLPQPVLPPGYTLHHLDNPTQLKIYYQLYSFASVHPSHQRDLLASEEYQQWVIASPEGHFVAFGECSICKKEWESSLQRIGWIDYIGTQPEQQGRGLGKAILLACLQCLADLGAEKAMLVTSSSNLPAIRLYEATGFQIATVKEPDSFVKILSP